MGRGEYVWVAGVGAHKGAGPRVKVAAATDEQVRLERAADLGLERALLSNGTVRLAANELVTQPRLDIVESVDRLVYGDFGGVRRIGRRVEKRGNGKVQRRTALDGACRSKFASDKARVSELPGRREAQPAVRLRERRPRCRG